MRKIQNKATPYTFCYNRHNTRVLVGIPFAPNLHQTYTRIHQLQVMANSTSLKTISKNILGCHSFKVSLQCYPSVPLCRVGAGLIQRIHPVNNWHLNNNGIGCRDVWLKQIFIEKILYLTYIYQHSVITCSVTLIYFYVNNI